MVTGWAMIAAISFGCVLLSGGRDSGVGELSVFLPTSSAEVATKVDLVVASGSNPAD